MTFGVNGWVLAQVGRGDPVQRQVTSAGRLSVMFRELHLTDDEAQAVADRVWRQRPGDFALPAAHSDESPRHATGIPGIVVIAALLALVAVAAYALFLVLGG